MYAKHSFVEGCTNCNLPREKNMVIDQLASEWCSRRAALCLQALRMGGKGRRLRGLPYVELLMDCAKRRDLQNGTRLHADIVKRELVERSPYISSSLIWMYAKCGALAKAREVVDTIHWRDVVCWTTLIAGYSNVSSEVGAAAEESWRCYGQMRREGVCPNEVTSLCLLKACGSMGALHKGKQVHQEIISRRNSSSRLGTALLDMYVKCGALLTAHRLFEQLPLRDTVSWSALIAGYARQEEVPHQHALVCFEQMRCEGVPPNEVTFTCVLKACGFAGAIRKGKEIHHEISAKGLLLEKKNIRLGNALVDMYAKCGMVREAEEVFEGLPVRNAVTWCALISGYGKNEGSHEAVVLLYEGMQKEGVRADAATLACVLAACGRSTMAMVASTEGERILKESLTIMAKEEEQMVLGNVVVDMYARWGRLARAQQVLESLPARNVASWTALIAGYAAHGHAHHALLCLARMRQEGISPNAITFTSLFTACRNTSFSQLLMDQHLPSSSLLTHNTFLATSLLHTYVTCGMLLPALHTFQAIRFPDAVSWSALISGYAQQQQGHNALDCFWRMQKTGLLPDMVTYVSVVKACASVGAAESGKRIHQDMARRGFIAQRDIVIGNTLIDMYGKCGMLATSQHLLEHMPVRNVVSWNALIAGYARDRRAGDALHCFAEMQTEGIVPDAITFLCVLDACRQSEEWDAARMHYESMRVKMAPMLEHQACMMATLVGCGGRLHMAMVINTMPSSLQQYPSLWLTLLGACRKWGDVRLAETAFRHVAN